MRTQKLFSPLEDSFRGAHNSQGKGNRRQRRKNTRPEKPTPKSHNSIPERQRDTRKENKRQLQVSRAKGTRKEKSRPEKPEETSWPGRQARRDKEGEQETSETSGAKTYFWCLTSLSRQRKATGRRKQKRRPGKHEDPKVIFSA